MCIIVYKPTTAKMPSKKTLQQCWFNNRDGAGYMFPSKGNVIIKKGFMKFKEFYSNLQTDLKRYGEFTPFVLHFRIQTQGGVNPQYTHPFPLSADMDDLKKLRVKTEIGIAHNGIIDITSEKYSTTVKYSDTMKFITDYLTLIIHDKNYYKDLDKLTLIENSIENNLMIEINYLDRAKLEKVFEENEIEAVMNFAGFKAVGESVQKPIEYYHNNITGTLVLLKLMKKFYRIF